MAARHRDKSGRFISAETYRRSRAASRAWKARHQREAAERQRRSDAARAGWAKRKQVSAVKRAGRTMRAAEERRAQIEGEPKQQEYVQAIRYKSPRGRQHFGTVQASIFAPVGTSKKDIAASVNQALTGGSAKFEVRIIKWLRSR